MLSARLRAESDTLLGFARYVVAFGFSHDGSDPADADRPIDPLLVLVETMGNRSARLSEAEAATLAVDGAGFELPLTRYAVLSDRTVSDSRGRTQNAQRPPKLDERLLLALPRDAARALAASRGGELRLPGLTLELTAEHAALARAAVLRSE